MTHKDIQKDALAVSIGIFVVVYVAASYFFYYNDVFIGVLWLVLIAFIPARAYYLRAIGDKKS